MGLLVGVALAGFLQFLRATGAPNLAIGEGSWLSSILARSSTWAEQTVIRRVLCLVVAAVLPVSDFLLVPAHSRLCHAPFRND